MCQDSQRGSVLAERSADILATWIWFTLPDYIQRASDLTKCNFFISLTCTQQFRGPQIGAESKKTERDPSTVFIPNQTRGRAVHTLVAVTLKLRGAIGSETLSPTGLDKCITGHIMVINSCKTGQTLTCSSLNCTKIKLRIETSECQFFQTFILLVTSSLLSN